METNRTKEINDRALSVVLYMIQTRATVRRTAEHFKLSKSTVHKYATERIWKISAIVAADVREVIEYNKQARYLRGGLATKAKYASGYQKKKK